MKLRNLNENDSQNTLNKMREWCNSNVIDYLNMYEAQDEDLLKFYPHTNQIFIYACEISSHDKELPYEILAGEFFSFSGKNLESFKNTPNVNNHHGKLPPLIFEYCNKLDFTKVYYDTTELEIHFVSMRKISPIELNTHQHFGSLSFEYCNDKNVYDISNYTRLNVIKKLFIIGGNKRLTNLTSIFDTQIKTVGNINSHAYINMKLEEFLIDTLNKYLKLGKDHIMDFTLDFIDNGFETDL